MRRRSWLLSVPVVVLLATGACTEESSLTLDEYIAEADARCAESDEAFDELGEPASPEVLPEYLREAQEIYEDLRADLGELDAPEDEAERIDELLGTLDRIAGGLDGAIAAAEDGDDQAVAESLGELAEVGEEADEIASELGFEECGIEDDGEAEFSETGDSIPTGDGADEYPVQYEPTQADIDAVVPLFSEGAGGLFTDEETECIVRYLLERVRLDEFAELPEALSEAAAVDCLTTARLVEIGLQNP